MRPRITKLPSSNLLPLEEMHYISVKHHQYTRHIEDSRGEQGGDPDEQETFPLEKDEGGGDSPLKPANEGSKRMD